MKKYLFMTILSLGSLTAFAQEAPASSFAAYNLFIEGGVGFMSLITLCLVGILLAAWKMPSRVKELGLGSLVIGIIALLAGLYQMFGVLQTAGDIPFSVICGGLKVTLIAPIWGCSVYLTSLIVRMIQKPKTI